MPDGVWVSSMAGHTVEYGQDRSSVQRGLENCVGSAESSGRRVLSEFYGTKASRCQPEGEPTKGTDNQSNAVTSETWRRRLGDAPGAMPTE